MLARAYITEWSAKAPWPDPVQVEQDLILSRLLIEIAAHPLLGEIFDALRSIADEIGLDEHRRKFPDNNSDMGTIWFDATPTVGGGTIRIKIESNVAETEPYAPPVSMPFQIESRWWSGQGQVRTFELDDLLGTKLRALYQRRKGRDLFDLWICLTSLKTDGERIVAALTHYMGDAVFTYPQLRDNLRDKLADPIFAGDLGPLVSEIPTDYDAARATQLVLTQLGARLRNAPAEPDASPIDAQA